MGFKAEEKSLDFCKSISTSNISPAYKRISPATFLICGSYLTLWLQLGCCTKKSPNFKNLLCVRALSSCIISRVSSLFAFIIRAGSWYVRIILSETPALGFIDHLNYCSVCLFHLFLLLFLLTWSIHFIWAYFMPVFLSPVAGVRLGFQNGNEAVLNKK